MRIEKLQVSGFGHLQRVDVELQGPVTVLYGPNEAGKSTLLGFVRAMLFGIPSRASGHLRYEPTIGSIHGGMLTLIEEDGARWSIERYAGYAEGKALSGTRGDRLRITKSDLEGRLRELSQEEMQRELLGGMSKEMFKQLFAVSLSELQEVSALQSDEMSRFLFHAGIGGGAAVLRGEKKLVQEMDKLYRPRGKNQEIAQMLQSLDRLRRDTDTAKSLLPRYNEVLEEMEETESRLVKATYDRTLRGQELNLLQKADTIRSQWIACEVLRVELEALPQYDEFPEQGLARWDALKVEKERLLLEVNEITRHMVALSSEMALLMPNLNVIERAREINSLATRLPSYESRVQQLIGLEAEAVSLRGQLDQCLQSIDPAWKVEDLRAFAGTVGEREAVRRYMVRFVQYDKEMERLQNERFKMEREVTALRSTYSSAVSRMDESKVIESSQFDFLIPQNRSEIVSLWGEIKLELDRWREFSMSRLHESRATAADTLAQDRIKSLYYRLLGGSAVLTLLLPIGLLLATGSLWNAAIGGGSLLLFDLFIWLGFKSVRSSNKTASRRSGRTESASPTEERLIRLLSKLVRQPLTAAGREHGNRNSFVLDSAQWDLEERQLRQMMESWYLWDQRHEDLEQEVLNCRGRVATALDELQDLERELTRRESAFDSLVCDWESWLSEHKLSQDHSPEAALEVFRLAEKGGEWLSRLDGLNHNIGTLQRENESFEAGCLSLRGVGSTSASVAGAFTEEEVLSAVSQLQKAMAELESHQAVKSQRDILAMKVSPLEEERGRCDDRLNRIYILERKLLEEAHADDEEDYFHRGANAARRDVLEKEIRQCNLVMFGGLEDDKRRQLELLLRGISEEELASQVNEARAAAEEVERQWLSFQEQRGRLLQEKESLEVRCNQVDLSQQLAEHKTALNESIDKYAVMAVCNDLISRVRRIYEEERQPEVLKAASGYFAEMTGGVYRRIVLKMGSQELMAEHKEHGPIESLYLSRGSAEQLYLSMRLALSEAVSGKGSLPILLDDLFVNFDASRLSGALSVLNEVSNRHQLIMMTCHKHVVEAVQSTIPSAQIIEL